MRPREGVGYPREPRIGSCQLAMRAPAEDLSPLCARPNHVRPGGSFGAGRSGRVGRVRRATPATRGLPVRPVAR